MPMHHPEPSGEELEQQTLFVKVIQARLDRAATAVRWISRTAEVVAGLREEIRKLGGENADLREEVRMWQRTAARRANLDPDVPPPPQNYVDALRARQLETYQAVDVDIDGQPWRVGFARHCAAVPNPVAEQATWQRLVAAVRTVREVAPA